MLFYSLSSLSHSFSPLCGMPFRYTLVVPWSSSPKAPLLTFAFEIHRDILRFPFLAVYVNCGPLVGGFCSSQLEADGLNM